jgi:hypothetical protein
MSNITVGFVTPKGTTLYQKILHTVAGQTVKLFTDSRYAHAYLKFDEYIIEAIAPRICVQPANKYDEEEIKQEIQFYVDEETYNMIFGKAISFVGTPYGFLDCIDGGLKDTGFQPIVENGEKTINCSELCIRALAYAIPYFDIESKDSLTPEQLRILIMEFIGRE